MPAKAFAPCAAAAALLPPVSPAAPADEVWLLEADEVWLPEGLVALADAALPLPLPAAVDMGTLLRETPASAQIASASAREVSTSSEEQVDCTHCVVLEMKVWLAHRHAVSVESQPSVLAVAMQVRRQSGMFACLTETRADAAATSPRAISEGEMRMVVAVRKRGEGRRARASLCMSDDRLGNVRRLSDDRYFVMLGAVDLSIQGEGQASAPSQAFGRCRGQRFPGGG